ncbi:helix-turn-helix transcriptional regulator [Orenia marismortui]|uniref:Putative transcriptional regulator n=1 Tax=Orenia marismortui TaxID=46469 RepID=A0A4R8HA47_9FIRM|nr:helix-turn-helix domain-containing protein [Orenia marismortui]TDX52178.1 putative transcriptional regulator [Orenia marismortui]
MKEDKKREILIKLRKKHDLTQKEIAAMLGISHQFYSSIERKERNPTLKLAKEIADLFNTTIENIFFNHSRRVLKNRTTQKAS